jgi:hypothetical protein
MIDGPRNRPVLVRLAYWRGEVRRTRTLNGLIGARLADRRRCGVLYGDR